MFRSIAAVTLPTTTLAIGAAKTLYSAISAVRSAAFATSWVTIRLFTWIEPGTKSPVGLVSLASMSVMSRPCEAAPVTTLPSMRQFTAQFVWPVMTMSISSSIIGTISGIAPVGAVASVDRVHVPGAVAGGRDAATFVQQHDDGLDSRVA